MAKRGMGMSWLPIGGWVAAALLISCALFVVCARHGWLTPSDHALRATYALPNSQFMNIAGEPIHYVDEGHGPAIVLLHGSFGSLRMWDDWAQALAAHYRVVRFDLPPMGLSGPNPTGRYDTNHELQIIDALTARLGIHRFFLVATSSAGVAGAAYAAGHPRQIEGLVLSDIAVGAFNVDRAQLAPAFKLLLTVDPLFGGWHPREFWHQVLLANIVDQSKISPALVREWTDLNNRAQRMPSAANSNRASMLERTPHDLPQITAPTLVLWSAQDHEFPVVPVAQRALELLASADKTLIVVPNCGHIMPIDCGAASAALAMPFLDRVAALENPP